MIRTICYTHWKASKKYNYIYISLAQVLIAIILLLSFTNGVDLSPRFSMLEYFSGKGNVSNAFRQTGLHQVGSYEIRDSPSMDFLSTSGFLHLGCNKGMWCDPLDYSSGKSLWTLETLGWPYWWLLSHALELYMSTPRYAVHGQGYHAVPHGGLSLTFLET